MPIESAADVFVAPEAIHEPYDRSRDEEEMYGPERFTASPAEAFSEEFWAEYSVEWQSRVANELPAVTPEEFKAMRDTADTGEELYDGAEGGKAVFQKYGREHMSEIGKKGFQSMVEKHWKGDRQAAIRRLTELGQMVGDPAPWNGAWQYPKRDDEPWDGPDTGGGLIREKGSVADVEQSPDNPLLAKLQEGLTQAMTAEGFQEYLEMRKKFHDYSANNVLLIMIQRPDATRVAGFNKWKEMGRYVKKGERGIGILAPITVKIKDDDSGEERRVVRGFKQVHVFDEAQTDGKPLPEKPRAQRITADTERGREIMQNVLDYLKREKVRVSFGKLPEEANGAWVPRNNAIMLSDELSHDMALKTLIHEITHREAGHGLKADAETDRVDREMVAEGATFLALGELGIDTSEYSIPYLAHWGENMEAFHRNLARIDSLSKLVLDKIGGSDEPR